MGRIETLGTFVLSCNHTVSFRCPWPTKGQIVTCTRCRMGRTISYRIREVVADCSTCQYHRSFGADEDTARRRAVRHARMHAHDVTVSRADVVLVTIIGRQNTVISL